MNAVRILRFVGIAEGISYISLLFVAMPMKYVFDMPLAVRITGTLHGGLFVAFVVALIATSIARRWSILTSALVFASSLIPFGPFLIEPTLQREMEAAERPLAPES